MLQTLQKIIVGITLVSGASAPLMGGCPLSITNAQINPKPLDYLGTGQIGFKLVEEGGRGVPATDLSGKPMCQFNVEMRYVTLENKNISNVTGSVLRYFDVTFNATQNRVYFKQKKDIPGNLVASADIAIDVTQSSTSAEKNNGFVLSMDGSSLKKSQFTYTKISAEYDIVLSVTPTTLLGSGSKKVALDLQISEYNSVSNSGDVIIDIVKDNKLTFTLDASNHEWELQETPIKYKLRYIGNNGKYPPHTRKHIKLSGVFKIPANQKGNFVLSASIEEGNGEVNFKNNQDSDTMTYNGIRI